VLQKRASCNVKGTRNRRKIAMRYRDDVSDDVSSEGPENGYEVRVPDDESLILLMELANARGVPAFVARRSRKRVLLCASESRVRELMKEYRAMRAVLKVGCLKILRELLQQNGIEFPEWLESFLVSLEIKTAMTEN
jgi:hypothetical protein